MIICFCADNVISNVGFGAAIYGLRSYFRQNTVCFFLLSSLAKLLPMQILQLHEALGLARGTGRLASEL